MTRTGDSSSGRWIERHRWWLVAMGFLLTAVVLSLTTAVLALRGSEWVLVASRITVGWQTAVLGTMFLAARSLRRWRAWDKAIEEGVRPESCIRCGYDLRGSVSSACPECGMSLCRGQARPD